MTTSSLEMSRNKHPASRRVFGSTNQTSLIRSLTATSSGVAAKILGLINQILSVTLISHALGAEGLQEQIFAIASVSWFVLTFCGMHTALPVLLIRCSDNSETFASIAKTAYLLALIGASGAALLTILILTFGTMSGAAAPIMTAAICNAGVLVLSLSERVFQASDRIGQFYLLNMIGTLVSFSTTFALSRFHGTASEFVAAYYAGLLVPFLAATFFILPRLNLQAALPWRDFLACARRLISVGIFGFGYELAAYCKLQAPLMLLGVLGLSGQIASVGLGLRLTGLIGGGLSIIVPILLVRIGTAIQAGDRDARRFWTYLGIASATAIAFAAAGLFAVFGETVYRLWTGGVVGLDGAQRVALAAFAALSLAQGLIFPLVAPDPAVTGRLQWLFWLEGPAVLALGAAGAFIVPAAYAGAGMLAGASVVMTAAILILLMFLMKASSSYGPKKGFTLKTQR
jgi:O-antigen/teichoic acid export membrane protein